MIMVLTNIVTAIITTIVTAIVNTTILKQSNQNPALCNSSGRPAEAIPTESFHLLFLRSRAEPCEGERKEKRREKGDKEGVYIPALDFVTRLTITGGTITIIVIIIIIIINLLKLNLTVHITTTSQRSTVSQEPHIVWKRPLFIPALLRALYVKERRRNVGEERGLFTLLNSLYTRTALIIELG